MKRILLFALVVFSMAACTNDPESPDTPGQQEMPADSMTGKEIMDDLRSQAISEDDLDGRLQSSIAPIREELKRSEASMPDLEGTQVTIDEECNFVFLNRANGKVEIRVNLTKLDPKGFSLIRDDNPGEFPGIRVRTVNDEEAVETYRNGELINRNNEFSMQFMDRPSVEKITPVLLQTILICRGDI